MARKVYQLRSDEAVERMLAKLQEEMGYKPLEAFREGLRVLYGRYVKPYGKGTEGGSKGNEDPQTAEEWADQQGGKLVKKSNGLLVIEVQEGAMTTSRAVPEKFQPKSA